MHGIFKRFKKPLNHARIYFNYYNYFASDDKTKIKLLFLTYEENPLFGQTRS